MPLNLLKKFPDLLELLHLDEPRRTASLLGIFKRDIEDNTAFFFRGKTIRPLKSEEFGIQALFKHLTCEEIMVTQADGSCYPKRIFENERSQRLHWIRCHIDELVRAGVDVFSVEERDVKKRKDTVRTYLYNAEQAYVVVLEPQRSGKDYYLLTAYYLNRPEGRKSIEKKRKKRLPEVL
ncbi:MAG: hypothetical protein ACO1NW_14355 [Chitinophagaceae bacterium]